LSHYFIGIAQVVLWVKKQKVKYIKIGGGKNPPPESGQKCILIISRTYSAGFVFPYIPGASTPGYHSVVPQELFFFAQVHYQSRF